MSDNRDSSVGRAIAQHAEHFAAPDDLRLAVRAMIGTAKTQSERQPFFKRLFGRPAWPALACGFAAGLALAVALGVGFSRFSPGHDATLVALVADHARAVVTQTTIEVATSDKHTVKPWLARELGTSPDVIDLASAGFPLLGGRRGYLAGQPVPVMAYGFKAHEIDVYALADVARNGTASAPFSMDGFHCVSWKADGFTYVAISDVDLERLNAFASAFQGAPRPRD